MYKIIEVANTHGGCKEYLTELIESFDSISNDVGIKFQPFKFDQIALPDFEWYETYTELFFEPEEWKFFIQKAAASKDVWLDIFDLYGVEILKNNLADVRGLKLQTSVLNNFEVIKSLESIDFSSCDLILNIAGRELDSIHKQLGKFRLTLRPRSVWLEIGFQGYPTEAKDSGLSKIKLLKEEFDCPLVFADHLDGRSNDASLLPIVSAALGVDAIEKHVMLESRETKYDHYSSLLPQQFIELGHQLDFYKKLMDEDFINPKERKYFADSAMKPILRHQKSRGSLINIDRDLKCRRSNQVGITLNQILKEQHDYKILTGPKLENQTLKLTDFRRAKIGVIVACRLKSSRLKRKALLKIGGISSVEYCLNNALNLSNVSSVILATSDLDEDAVLKSYCLNGRVQFFAGHPIDVIDRFYNAAMENDIDVIVRVTADCPFLDDEIFNELLNSHFKSGADYTTASSAAVGTNFEIFNLGSLNKLKARFPYAPHSEYMTWYFKNNPEHFFLNMVKLPDEIVRDYRLTLDYQEDLDLFNKIDAELFNTSVAGSTKTSLRKVFSYLDNNPIVACINSQMQLKYQVDQALIQTLNSQTKF